MTAGSGATLTDPGLRGNHSSPRRSSPPWVGRAQVIGLLSAFHRSPRAGSDGGAGPGRRAHGLAERDATAPTSFTALRGSSEAITSRHREPLPHCQEQPLPVSCLPIPGKDIAGFMRACRVWAEGHPSTSSPRWLPGVQRDEGPS